jgi:hypothetical protein
MRFASSIIEQRHMNASVIIIGAGPTGLMSAYQLGRFGISCILVDSKASPTIYDQKDVANTFDAAGEGLTDFPYMHVFERSNKNEQQLAEVLAQQGNSIWWNTEFLALEQNRDSVTVRMQRNLPEQQTITLRGKYVIGCDDDGSKVRKAFGGKFKFQEGRCFLPEESAQANGSVGEAGMNTGLQNGYNLAWKLALILQGYGSKFLTKQNTGNNMFQIISQIWNSYNKNSFSLKLTSQKLSFKAGDRFPHVLISRNGQSESSYHLFRQAKFHLVVIGKDPADEEVNVIPARMRKLIHVVVFPMSEAWSSLGVKQSLYILVRPDNYIGLISDELDKDLLERYFERLN